MTQFADQISCQVCRDLLPLYADGITSTESAALVESHTAACDSCRTELGRLRLPAPLSEDTPKRTIKQVKKRIHRKRRLAVTGAVAGTAALLLLLLGVQTKFHLPVELRPEDVVSVRFGGAATEDPLPYGNGFHVRPHDLTITWNIGASDKIAIDAQNHVNPDGSVTESLFLSLSVTPIAKLLQPGKQQRDFSAGLAAYRQDPDQPVSGDALPEPYEVSRLRIYYVSQKDLDRFYELSRPIQNAAGDFVDQALLDESGELLPEIAKLATLIWEGPVA
ncbi:MAG: zf-HC2 domain-containing protein [Oscillospiraceae bacterium]|nr:zf-HC2 domain-containing protein [Oscillospiraceae bacterium]